MNTAWMVMMVLVLGGGKAPETRVIVDGIVEQNECYAKAKRLNAEPPEAVDDVTGRPLLSKTYVCTPVSVADLQHELDRLKKN